MQRLIPIGSDDGWERVEAEREVYRFSPETGERFVPSASIPEGYVAGLLCPRG